MKGGIWGKIAFESIFEAFAFVAFRNLPADFDIFWRDAKRLQPPRQLILSYSLAVVALAPRPVRHRDKSIDKILAGDIGNPSAGVSGIFFGEDVANIA